MTVGTDGCKITRRLMIAAIAIVSFFFSSALAQSPDLVVRQAGKLAPHAPIEGELGPGQTDVLIVDVDVGLFLHIDLEQKGVNAVLEVSRLDGQTMVAADTGSSAFGLNFASLVAAAQGPYEVRV